MMFSNYLFKLINLSRENLSYTKRLIEFRELVSESMTLDTHRAGCTFPAAIKIHF